jgi:hypothetical protein
MATQRTRITHDNEPYGGSVKYAIEWILKLVGGVVIIRMFLDHGIGAVGLMVLYSVCFLLFITSDIIADWWRNRHGY